MSLVATALKPSLLDSLSYHDRPEPTAVPAAASSSCASPTGANAREAPLELPHALPHFCLPRGVQLRTECTWPTVHEFALTDAEGRRMYGCCLVVWEHLEGSLIVQAPMLQQMAEEAATSASASSSAQPESAAAEPWVGARHRSNLVECEPSAAGAPDAGSVIAARGLRPLQVDLPGGASPASNATGAAAKEVRDTAAGGETRVGSTVDAADGASERASATNDESSARRAEAMRIAFMAGSMTWLLKQGTEPGSLLPSQVALRGSELFVPKCLCVLARFPFLLSLRRWLCQLYRHSLSPSGASLEQLIASLLWESPMPPPGHITVSLRMGGEAIHFARPAPAQQLPLTQLPLGALLHSLPPPSLLRLFQSAMLEHKMVLVSKHLSKLTAAAEALTSFLWPMRWQGVYIPLLPAVMSEIMQSPVPFILGVHADAFAHARSMVRTRAASSRRLSP